MIEHGKRNRLPAVCVLSLFLCGVVGCGRPVAWIAPHEGWPPVSFQWPKGVKRDRVTPAYYGYHATQWRPWPGECSFQPPAVSEGTPFPEEVPYELVPVPPPQMGESGDDTERDFEGPGIEAESLPAAPTREQSEDSGANGLAPLPMPATTTTWPTTDPASSAHVLLLDHDPRRLQPVHRALGD